MDSTLSSTPNADPPVNASADTADRKPRLHIRPRTGWAMLPLREMWQYRDLLWLFTMRDIKVRYKQSVLGALWAIIQPITQMVVFTIFFGKILGAEDKVGEYMGKAVPYAVFVLSGQVLWNFFSTCVRQSSMSVVAQANLVRKVYFPRLILPISACGAPLVDMSLAFLVLLGMMLFYQLSFSVQLLMVPLFFITTIIAALGVGLILAALTVSYRDFRHVVGFMISIWFFVTPVIITLEFIPEFWNGIPVRTLLYLNPMAGTIEGFRSVVLDEPINYSKWALSVGVSVVAMIVGAFYFCRVERKFADIA